MDQITGGREQPPGRHFARFDTPTKVGRVQGLMRLSIQVICWTMTFSTCLVEADSSRPSPNDMAQQHRL